MIAFIQDAMDVAIGIIKKPIFENREILIKIFIKTDTIEK
jgi:hypothetical protein